MRELSEREREIAYRVIHEWQATGCTIDHLGERFACALAKYGDERAIGTRELIVRCLTEEEKARVIFRMLDCIDNEGNLIGEEVTK